MSSLSSNKSHAATEVQIFWDRCYRYAYQKTGRRDVAEEFAQEAYIFKFHRKWFSTLKQFFAHFVRGEWGTQGGTKDRIHRAISFGPREVLLESGDRLDFLENRVAAEKKEEALSLSFLEEEEREIIRRLDEGFSRREIAEAMDFKVKSMAYRMSKIQLKFLLSKEGEELKGRKAPFLISEEMEVKRELAHRPRLKRIDFKMEIPSVPKALLPRSMWS